MNLKKLRENLKVNARHLETDLLADFKAEGKHIADPAQCGNIVRRHFGGLTMTLLAFTALFIAASVVAIFWYMHA